MSTTANTKSTPLPTLADIKASVKAVKSAQDLPDGQWTLISPDGRVWRGEDPLTVAARAMPLSSGFLMELGSL